MEKLSPAQLSYLKASAQHVMEEELGRHRPMPTRPPGNRKARRRAKAKEMRQS